MIPPAEMTVSEKKSYQKIVAALVTREIDPSSRAHLIEDCVFSESALVALRAQCKSSKGKERLAASRAINTATAERRRIHSALFAEDKLQVAPPRTGDYSNQFTEADKAWIEFRYDARQTNRDKQRAALAKREEAIKKKFGAPSWSAVLFALDGLNAAS